MTSTGNTWAMVLAAGDGNRLRSLTTDRDGVAVPKQFCSLRGGRSLLHETLDRGLAIAGRERTVAIVADAHYRWWSPLAGAELPAANLVAQPRNRGTGNGILLPLLHIVNRDPDARVVILPSDHFVRREGVLRAHVRRAARELGRYEREIVLLGIAPEEPDPELGWVEPAADDGAGFRTVARFVEKPAVDVARELQRRGGLWNSFIMAARAQALLDLYATSFPEVVMAMVGAMRADAEGWSSGGLRDLYDDLPDIDFSRHVIAGAEARLRLLPVPACGWSDLGTPERVARTLTRLAPPARARERRAFMPAFLNLADAHLRLQASA
jgi:mannose-1-phosphate guanylyltransferase